MSLLGLAIAAHAGAAHADPLAVEIVDWGVWRSRDLYTVPAPGTTSGVATMGEKPREILRTDRIEACPGVQFGVQYVAVAGLVGASAPVIVEVRHPPFTARGQKDVTVEPMSGIVADQPRHFGWGFDNDYERVEGDWTIAVVVEGADAAAKTFSVVKPEHCAAPDS